MIAAAVVGGLLVGYLIGHHAGSIAEREKSDLANR